MDIYAPLPGAFTLADLLTVGWLFAAWLAIGWITEHPPRNHPSVSEVMKTYRREWMRHFVTRDPRIFERYTGKMGSAVGVTLHMGNWELSSWPMARWGGNPAAIYRLVKNPYVDAYLRAQRRDLFPGGLLAKGKAYGDNTEGQRTARLIIDYVRKGGRLGIVSDLYDKNGLPVPFFGKLAKSTPVPAMIARRAGSRIWIARCLREGRSSRFVLEVKELKVPRTSNMAEDIRTITAAIQAQFEAWIRECPEQWMWSNRKWS